MNEPASLATRHEGGRTGTDERLGRGRFLPSSDQRLLGTTKLVAHLTRANVVRPSTAIRVACEPAEPLSTAVVFMSNAPETVIEGCKVGEYHSIA